MNRNFYLFFSALILLSFASLFSNAQERPAPQPLAVGFSIGIDGITTQKMAEAKAAGITQIEASLGAWIKDRRFTFSDQEMRTKLLQARETAEAAGINIWSIHMPYGKDIDISIIDEQERKKVVALHQQVLQYAAILKPEVILFHPSYYLGLNERAARNRQLIKSALVLRKSVKAIKADMVIENMLGFDLLVDAQRERPLLRSVEEVTEVMNRLPKDIYAAIDMNHIAQPERLILAMGKRLKSVHIADGNGKQENHFLPCSGQGKNDWVKILSALDEVGYKGPFIYESAYTKLRELSDCYQTLFQNFKKFKARPVYTPATALTLVGKLLPTKNPFHRIDTADYPDAPLAVKKLLTNSAGLAIAFKTNSTSISAKWKVTEKTQLANLTPIANKGLDLYIKKNGKWQFAGAGSPYYQSNESVLVRNMDNTEKECLLYLPLYAGIDSLDIGVQVGAQISAGAQPFKDRVLVYGTSIVQGASASRPGIAYPAMLSRKTGFDFLNMGMSGSAKMEKAVADMVIDIPAVAYVIDCVPNSTENQINERTAYLVSSIRKAHPDAPIIVVQSVILEHGYFNLEVGKNVRAQNVAIKNQVEMLKKQGIENLHFIAATDLLGHDHEGTIDGSHPSDLGFQRMVDVLEPAIMAILKKSY